MTASTIFTIFTVLIPLLAILAIISAFRKGRKEKSVLGHIQVLRRSIGAAFLLGFIIMLLPSSRLKSPDSYNFAGPILLSISAIHYGYARKAEKAALASGNSK